MEYKFIQGCKYLVGIPSIDQQKAVDISNKFSLSMPLARTLLARDFLDYKSIEDFLITSKEKDVADSSLMKGASIAIDRIEKAIKNKEKMLIFGDYDVDGITSSSLLMVGLLPLGAKVNFYLPNRVKDGYGISKKIVQKAVDNNYDLLITVDNGTTAYEPAKLAKELGIDLIITDHHRPHGETPDAYVIVNPQQEDCDYPFKDFAGVGVAFKLISLLYERRNLKIPAKIIELLLFGTVADVVPLVGENRYWVREGLAHVNKNESYALRVLKENSKFIKPSISSIDIGFSITPQINALGRLDDARQGVQFLIGTDQDRVDQIGKVLFQMNQARKEVERGITQSILDKIETKKINIEKENIVIDSSMNWPAGVIGLVASRIVSAVGRPTLLFHITKNGIAKGSCRSIPEFNIFNALRDSKDLLISFGGHSHAAGLSLKVENLEALKERLEKRIAEELTEFDLKQKLMVDSMAQLSDFSAKFVNEMKLFEPFGHCNLHPSFYIKGVVLVRRPQLLKDLHLKCMVFADGVIKPVIFFNRPELFELLVNQADEPFDIVGQVIENYWNGSMSVELLGTDVVINNENKN